MECFRDLYIGSSALMVAVPVSSLVDAFGSLSAYWDSNYGGATASGGYGYVPCTHTGGTPNYAGFLSTRPSVGDTWTMSSSSLSVEVVTRPVASGATVCYCQMVVLSPTSGTYLSILYDAVGGNISFGSYVGFSDASLVVIPHIPSLHRWWRIRHGSGRIYWETSADGTTWTTRRTLTGVPSWVITSAVSIQLDSSRNGGTNDYTQFDNVNLAPYSTTVSPPTVSAIAAVPSLGVAVGIATQAVSATTTVPAPNLEIGISPTTVSAVADIPAPIVRASTTHSPNLIAVSANVLTPTIVVSATMLVIPPGITFIRYPTAQIVFTVLTMPLCGGSATTVSLSGTATALTLSGSAVVI